MYQDGLELKNLVRLEDWQKIQDSFSEAFGITLRTIDVNGKPFSRISKPCRLWIKIPSNVPNYSEFCGRCIIKTRRKFNIKEETCFKCPIDLDIFVFPIKVFGNKITAYVTMGPLIINKRKDKSEYAKYAELIGIDIEELMDALLEINVFSHSKVRSIIASLNNTFSYMARTGFHKKRLGKIAYRVAGADPLFSSYYEEEILNSLLNTCAIAFDIDSGSVMTVDKDSGQLLIKAASKLDESVISGTNLKMGEGIAGLAASMAEPIILPKDKNKNGLSKKMKRANIKSSMIIPFNKANAPDVYGVINLNIVRKDREFSEKDIALAKELINLASIALTPLK